MKIFVTGATGFIGNELVLALLDKGYEVVAMYRDQRKIRVPEQSNLTWVKADLLDKDRLVEVMKGCDCVFHLAAYAKVWSKQSDDFRKINITGTENVLEAAYYNGVKKIIATSTAGVIGPSNGDPVNEQSQRTVGFFSIYEETKYEAEKIIRNYIQKGLNIVTLLPTRLYGPGLLNESNSVTILIDKYLQGKWRILPGNGSKIGNYVFIEDVVKGHMIALERNIQNERFLIGGEDISYAKFFETIARISGRKMWMIPLNQYIIIGVGYILFYGARLFGRTPRITPGWARKYIHHWSVSSKKAIDQLGYTITPLDVGMKKTINWLNNGNHE